MTANLTRGTTSIGMRTIAPPNPTLPLPDFAIPPEDIMQEILQKMSRLETVVEKKADSDSIRSYIAMSDEMILISAQQIVLDGEVTIGNIIRHQNGTLSGELPPEVTRIVGDVIQTGTIRSNNWGPTAGSAWDLNNGIMIMGGSESPSLYFEGGNLFLSGSLTAESIVLGKGTLGEIADEAAGAMKSADFEQMLDDQLAAGVGNITAGVGNDFVLEVEGNAIYARHHQFNQAGTGAYTGTLRTALFLSANGIAMGYNQRSNGAFVPAVTIESTGQVNVRGTITAGSVIAGSVTVNGTQIEAIRQDAQFGAGGIYELTNNGGSTVLRGVVQPAEQGAIRVGNISWNTSTGVVTSGTGVAMTPFGIVTANDGNTTFALQSANGSAFFGGDIETSGRIVAQGNYSVGGIPAAFHALPTNVNANGYNATVANGTAFRAIVGVSGIGLSIQKSASSAGIPALEILSRDNLIAGNLEIAPVATSTALVNYEGALVLRNGFMGTRSAGRVALGSQNSGGGRNQATLHLQTWEELTPADGDLGALGIQLLRIRINNQEVNLLVQTI